MELGFPKPGDVESRLGHCVGQLGTWRAGTQAEGDQASSLAYQSM